MSTGAENVARLARRLLLTELRPDEREFVDTTQARLGEIADVVADHRRALDELWARAATIDPAT